MIPTIKLSEIRQCSEHGLESLRRANQDIGLFYFDPETAFTTTEQARLFDLARRFFDLGSQQKESVSISKATNYRGYVALGEEYTSGKPDLKESLELGQELNYPIHRDAPLFHALYGSNQYPDTGLVPGLAEAITDFHRVMEYLGRVLTIALIKSLPIPRSVHDHLVETCLRGAPFYFSRLISYRSSCGFRDRSMRLEPHKDEGLLTILFQESPGLYVRDIKGEWLEASPPPGMLVVFVSQLFEFLSNGFYEACVHAVPNRSLPGNRLSVGFFYFPDLHNTMTPIGPHVLATESLDDLIVAGENIWLTEEEPAAVVAGSTARPNSQPFVLGEKLWQRVKTVFPE